MKISDAAYVSEAVIVDKDVPGLDNSSVVIVIHRNTLDLDHCPVIVVLNIGIIIITGVITNVHVGCGNIYAGTTAKIGIVIEIEFTIRINCKFHCIFNKNEGVVITAP